MRCRVYGSEVNRVVMKALRSAQERAKTKLRTVPREKSGKLTRTRCSVCLSRKPMLERKPEAWTALPSVDVGWPSVLLPMAPNVVGGGGRRVRVEVEGE